VCSSEDLQARAHDALVARAERDASFRARCAEAAERGIAARRRRPPRPEIDPSAAFGAESRAVAEELAARSRGAS
jgi:beta-N-acetylhexosaminidase